MILTAWIPLPLRSLLPWRKQLKIWGIEKRLNMMFSRLLQVALAIILAEAANGASYRSGKNNRDLIKAEKNFRDGKICKR